MEAAAGGEVPIERTADALDADAVAEPESDLPPGGAPLGEPAGLFHRKEGLAAAGAAAHLDAWEQSNGVEDDGLMFGQQVGGVVVAKRSGDDVALR